MSKDFIKALTITKKLADADHERGQTLAELYLNYVSEQGELADAIAVENGFIKKELAEPAYSEAADVAICALALFFQQGGLIEGWNDATLTKIIQDDTQAEKLLKTITNIGQEIADKHDLVAELFAIQMYRTQSIGSRVFGDLATLYPEDNRKKCIEALNFAVALYLKTGGKADELPTVMLEKLKKWEAKQPQAEPAPAQS